MDEGTRSKRRALRDPGGILWNSIGREIRRHPSAESHWDHPECRFYFESRSKAGAATQAFGASAVLSNASPGFSTCIFHSGVGCTREFETHIAAHHTFRERRSPRQ